jgi:hypothetical protein
MVESVRTFVSDPDNAAQVGAMLASIENTYAKLFDALGLSPETRGRLLNLLLERAIVEVQLRESMPPVTQHIGGPAKYNSYTGTYSPPGIVKMMVDVAAGLPERKAALANAFAPVDQKIQNLLGDTGYAEYSAYRDMTYWRNGTVPEIQKRLEASGVARLTPDQERTLLLVMAVANPGGDLSINPLSNQALNQASQFLDPDQVEVLVNVSETYTGFTAEVIREAQSAYTKTQR